MAICFENVTVELGGRTILKEISVGVPQKGLSFITGASGQGKSVLCQCATGLLPISAGEVKVLGKSLLGLNEASLLGLRAQVPYVVQLPALFGQLTVEENIALAMHAPISHKPLSPVEALGLLGWESLLRLRPAALTPGQQKCVSLARALALKPSFLILDEPTTGLDLPSADSVYLALERLKAQGLGALVVSHDIVGLVRLADQVAFVHNQKIVFYGDVPAFRQCKVAEVKALREAALGLD